MLRLFHRSTDRQDSGIPGSKEEKPENRPDSPDMQHTQKFSESADAGPAEDLSGLPEDAGPLITVICAVRSEGTHFIKGADSTDSADSQEDESGDTDTSEGSPSGDEVSASADTENMQNPKDTQDSSSGSDEEMNGPSAAETKSGVSFSGNTAETAPAWPFSFLGEVQGFRLQVLTVQEPDHLHPRKASLEMLSQAEGEYVLFLDEGDTVPPKGFLSLLSPLEDPAVCFACAGHSGPYSQEGSRGAFRTNYIVDIRICQTLFPVGLHGILFRRDALMEACHYVVGDLEQEKQVLRALLVTNPVFSRVGKSRIQCALPQESDYMYCLQALEREWYFEPLEQYLLPMLSRMADPQGHVSRFLQYLSLYMLQVRYNANLNNRNKHVLSKEEALEYSKVFSRVLDYVDTSTILGSNCVMTQVSLRERFLLLRLKHRDFSWYPELVCAPGGFRFITDGIQFGDNKSLPVNINLIDYIDGNLEIDGSISDYFSTDIATLICHFDGQTYPVTYNQRYSLTKAFGVTYAHMKTFHVSVPVEPSQKDRLMTFRLHTCGLSRQLEYSFPSHTSRFAKDFNYGSWKFGTYLAFWKPNGIHIVPSSPVREIKKEAGLLGQLWKRSKGKYRKEIPLNLLSFLLRPYFSKKKVWLFFDKIYKGGDSSEYLYKYALAQKDGILKYYLLDKNSADYARMRKEGYHPIKRGSMMHRLIFLNATMVIASNSTVFAFNDYDLQKSMTIRGQVRFDVACVQHGMSVQKIAIAQNRLRDNTKLYFCASPYEIKNLSHPVYDYTGYPYQCLYLTGVPRYDGLKNRAEKILLFSPTWRMQSAMPVTKNEGVARDYNPNFKNTDYFRVYNGLLNDPRLLDAARRFGYRIQYVLHPIVSPQVDDFDRNDLVEIIPAIGDMSYEKLFCEAALMVTDFSGVQFDFAYMRKPVVYLHHNDIPQHYEEGAFFYDTMGFGEICHTNDELIDVLCRYMEADCVMPQEYRKRADDFFAWSDHSNCERIYPVMVEHEKLRDQWEASAWTGSVPDTDSPK